MLFRELYLWIRELGKWLFRSCREIRNDKSEDFSTIANPHGTNSLIKDFVEC